MTRNVGGQWAGPGRPAGRRSGTEEESEKPRDSGGAAWEALRSPCPAGSRLPDAAGSRRERGVSSTTTFRDLGVPLVGLA